MIIYKILLALRWLVFAQTIAKSSVLKPRAWWGGPLAALAVSQTWEKELAQKELLWSTTKATSTEHQIRDTSQGYNTKVAEKGTGVMLHAL